jgi:hypothetical protein
MKAGICAHMVRLLKKAQEPFLFISERHLGHAIRVNQSWIAYDAIRFNPSNDGFRIIGTFETIDAAKKAIEARAGLGWLWETGGNAAQGSGRHA